MQQNRYNTNMQGFITFDEALVKYNKLVTDFCFNTRTLSVLVNSKFCRTKPDQHTSKRVINEDDLKRVIYFLNQQIENSKIKIS